MPFSNAAQVRLVLDGVINPNTKFWKGSTSQLKNKNKWQRKKRPINHLLTNTLYFCNYLQSSDTKHLFDVKAEVKNFKCKTFFQNNLPSAHQINDQLVAPVLFTFTLLIVA